MSRVDAVDARGRDPRESGGKDVPPISYFVVRNSTSSRYSVMANAENEIIKAHDDVIACEAKKLLRLGVSLDDLIQEGRLALLECSRRNTCPEKAALWTFARCRVVGAMLDAVARVLRSRAHVRPLGDGEECLVEDPSALADEAIGAAETEQALAKALRSLAPDERDWLLSWLSSEWGTRGEDAAARASRRRFNRNVETLRERMGVATPS